MANTLYDTDFNLWIDKTSQALHQRDFESLDWNNLIEEVETLGRSEKNALENNLEKVLMHLLKWKYQSDKGSNSLHYTIVEHRNRLHKAFESSPSLKNYDLEVFNKCYRNAVKLASAETGLSKIVFPVECPFTTEQAWDDDYLPENCESE